MRAKILNASAGSGKTFRLAYKYVHDTIQNPDRYKLILAVTFTNKATEEMKSRILKEIHTLASGGESPYLKDLKKDLQLTEAIIRERALRVRTKILHDYSRFTVLTIDTFFQRILRSFIKELGIDMNYNIELEHNPVLTKSCDQLIEQITSDEELKQWMVDFVKERVDEGEQWDIRTAIRSIGEELFKENNRQALLKTHSRKELKEIISKASLTAIRTRKRLKEVADEAIKILQESGNTVDIFKYGSSSGFSFFYKIQHNDIENGYSQRSKKFAEDTDAWCKDPKLHSELVAKLQPLMQEAVSLYDNHLKDWNTYDLLRQNWRSFALLADLRQKIVEMCKEQNMMLLSETKYLLSEFINENDVPFIYEKVGNRFERFMIDEFQDTSTKEWQNFVPLLANAMSQTEEDETSVLLVGDIKQSIYRWRGGDWRLLHSEAQQDLGESETEVERMKDNYRSLPAVVEFNNRAITHMVALENSLLNTQIDEALSKKAISPRIHSLLKDTLEHAYTEHSQTAKKSASYPGYISIETCDNEPPIVETICSLIDRGYRPSDIMILVSKKTNGEQISAKLLEFKKHNTDPKYRFDVMTQEALIIGSAPVSEFIISTLRLTLDLGDKLSLANHNYFLQRRFDEPLSTEEQDLLSRLKLYSPEEAFERIVMAYDLQNDEQQTAYLQAIHEQIITFSANKVADIPLYIQWWEEQGFKQSLSIEESASTIEISTIHKAKGLEKRAVIIPYCTWILGPKTSAYFDNYIWSEPQDDTLKELGKLPIKYNKKMANSAFSEAYYQEIVYSYVDNVNLLYVALTRSKESLHIFVPQGDRKEHIGTHLITAMEEIVKEGNQRTTKVDGKEVTVHYDFTMTKSEDEDGYVKYEYGKLNEGNQILQSEAPRSMILKNYNTTHAKLKLHLQTQRYEEENVAELSPRNFGILMHRTFQEARNEEEIYRNVKQMYANGMITEEEASTLKEMLTRALKLSEVKEWFSEEWDEVRNEHDIIRPKVSTRRPDRVMIQGKRAMVVDYKFGEERLPSYHRQIREYLKLLREMGYEEVKGYLWYVMKGEIDQVTEND